MAKRSKQSDGVSQDSERIDRRKAKREENKRRKDEKQASRASATQPAISRASADSEKRVIAEPMARAMPVPSDGDARIAIRFSPLDTWFFRESRPHNAVGAAELSSQFPPPARTLVGALRTLVGEQLGVDWDGYREAGQSHPLAKVIGFGDELAPLDIDGPWPVLDGQRLYPAPAFLLRQSAERGHGLRRLVIGSPVETDLGRLRLPVMPANEQGAKPLNESWLTASGLAQVLAGEVPPMTSVRKDTDLFEWEPRLGIARDNLRRSVEEHMLYQTRHLRPNPHMAVELGVRGLDARYRPGAHAAQRLGGEGRLASLQVMGSGDPLDAVRVKDPNESAVGLILVALTPVDLDGGWLPDGFEPDGDDTRPRTWCGKISGVFLRVHAAVVGKALREGGWELMQAAPRAVRSFVPAGSAWYCTLDDGEIAHALERLHGSRIGRITSHRLGRGLIGAGIWPRTDVAN